MPDDVDWVASALLAAWDRQEIEGRYRGADEFRALHIDPADALASWQASTRPVTGWPPELVTWFGEMSGGWPEADALGLDAADRLVAAVARAVEVEPRLRPLVAALGDDATRPVPTIGLLTELAGAAGLEAQQVRRSCAATSRLAWFDVVRTVTPSGRPAPLDVEVVAGDWLLDPHRPPSPDAPVARAVGAAVGGAATRVLHLHGADHVRHAEQAAALVGRDAVVEIVPDDETRVALAARTAALAAAVLVLRCDERPPGWLPIACERVWSLGVPVALSSAPGLRWMPPARWADVEVAPLGHDARVARWRSALADLDPDPTALTQVATEFVLGADAVDDAVERVRAHGRADLATLRLAARTTAWQDLTSVARPGPGGVGWGDLVVPPAVLAQLHEIAGAIGGRGQVLGSWGFGDRPGGRGYHLLFAGPSGTGKTLAAGVIAGVVGRELWVVDLARVVDKYLGETEKQLDRVLRAGQASGAVLLFDEADALFGRRGDVRDARDRWANVEVAYLLQRIEDHDGVTVLTTNLGQHLDDAFARRISQRVEFAMPDAALRRQLWRISVPTQAPLLDEQALVTVADRFELAGGAIRTAALNAAYEAAAASSAIELVHLVRASVRELTKAGRPPTRAELAELAPLVGSR